MKRIDQLDGLRFIAVTFVLIEHFASIIGRYISAGFYGVDLFFVISGFLITGILLNSKGTFGVIYKKFIGRRTLRIFPLYYLTIIILLLAKNEIVNKYLAYFLTYTYNYVWVDKTFQLPGNMGHFWSLCVEEQFYLFWPFIILGCKKKLNILKAIILFIILICSLQFYFNLIPALSRYNYFSIVPRANSLVIGGFGAILLREKKIPTIVMESKLLEYSVFIILIFTLITGYQIKFTICPIISLYFILKACNTGFFFLPLDRFLKNRKVIYLGTISYGIYIFHVPIEYYFGKNVFDPIIWNNIPFESFGVFKKIQWHSWVFKISLYGIMSAFLAHLSYKYFEKPVLSLKDKYFKY